MILSAELTFSASQVVTTSAASTNIIDLGAPGTVFGAPAALVRDIGKGKPIPVSVTLDIAATGTSPTLQIDVEVDNDVAFGSAKTTYSSQTLAGGAAGGEVIVMIPQESDERYIRLAYTTGGTTPSYQLTAAVVADKQTSQPVPGV